MVANLAGAAEADLRKERTPGGARLQQIGDNMADLIFILISAGFFALAWGMVRLCDTV
jgi:hypothetical protein